MNDVYYTILPPQGMTKEKQPELRLLNYRGVLLYASPYDEEHYQIQQICSTNPADYLCQDLQPGKLIPLMGVVQHHQ